MTSLVEANELVFCLVLIAYLLVAFIGTVSFAMSISYKLKLRYVLPEIIISIASITLFCYLSDAIRIRYLGEDPNQFKNSLCFLPLWSVILFVVILLALACIWLIMIIKIRLSHLTAMSIKEGIAILSSGLCFYDETGRILLLNEQMDNECRKIMGVPLYDGLTFWSNLSQGKVKEGKVLVQNDETIIVELPEGRAISYKRIIHEVDEKIVYEISGADITRELVLKKETEQKNEDLRKMNLRLRQYGEIVAEVTKERETLAARVKVHGNLGSLILRTKKALSQGEYDRKALLSEWNDIMSLIFASETEEDKFSEADKTAASIGVRIIYEGKRPVKGTKSEKIFASAIFECAVNTARHADGSELYVKMNESEKETSLMITNNGKKPSGEIKEGGGLSSLRAMTEHAGGTMIITSSPQFRLVIKIPKE